MRTIQTLKHLFLFGALAFAVSACSCSDKECKSSRDCDGAEICRNGKCVISGFPTSTDSSTATADGETGRNTDYKSTDSATTGGETDSQTDTSSDAGDTVDTTTTAVASDSEDNSTDSKGDECTESWQCNDDNVCTTEACLKGVCITTQTTPVPDGCCSSNSDCSDQNSCTADRCTIANYTCEHIATTGDNCCTADLDCNDGNNCTIDSCTLAGTCIHVADVSVYGCCQDVNDCGSSSCSLLSCIGNQCVATFPETLTEGCCVVADDCPPGEGACTVASCNSRGECEYETNPSTAEGCCMIDDDCDDGNNCNVDECTYTYQCVHHAPVSAAPGCCLNDGDCADGDNCTADACVDNVCSTTTPNPLPAGCCESATDCNDWNDCTRDICSNGHCYSEGDPALGNSCCLVDADCDDGNACTQDSCDSFSSECVNLAPEAGSLPDGCCLVNSDCTDTDAPCNIGSCGPSPKYTCAYTTAADEAPCGSGLYCEGARVCSSGTCISRPEDQPCSGGVLGDCRTGSCDNDARTCVVTAEYDTDVPCDDGLFCNGVDVCLAGDCVHRNPPCAVTDTDTTLDACEEVSCNETSDACEVAFRPNFSSCENSLGCDGVNMCFEGNCEAGNYCGEGNDCVYYTCEEDTSGGVPICTENFHADGTECQTPNLGACVGTTGRSCVSGICSMGSDPMCAFTAAANGFCKEYYCVESMGAGFYPSGGCGTATFDPTDTSLDTDSEPPDKIINMLGCAAPDDTDSSTDYSNTIGFTTSLEYNKVSDYGTDPDCVGTFSGGDLIYQIDLVQDQDITVAISGLATTDTDTSGYNVSVMILSDACNAHTCTHSATGTTSATIANFIAPATGPYYIVIDTVDRVYAAGTLTVTCN